ncbi:MAG: amidohydrolase [bacterium]
MKENIKKIVNELTNEFHGYVKNLYDNPEIGNEEVYGSKLLSDILVKNGFETKHPYVLETDYLGVYKSKKDGPKIGFMCEYDALPDIGHGCGHNLIGVTSILAAVSLKNAVDELGGSLHVFGTPAEENFGGKVHMAAKGVFDEMDICMQFHPSSKNGIGNRSSAIIPMRFEFKGKTAHGCRPYEGASALDACVMTYQNINMLRQFAKPGTFIHGVITNGGSAANVIPDYSCADYYFRAPTIAYAKEIVEKAKNIANSCAQANNCTVTDSIYECIYEDTKINYTSALKLKSIMEEHGLTNVHDVNETPAGSTDVGATSYKCPTVQGNIKICDNDVNGHSVEFASCTISPVGKKALTDGAICLALLGLECLMDKELIKQMKEEFLND